MPHRVAGLESYALTRGLIERDFFGDLPLGLQLRLATKRPQNQDACFAGSIGALVADGVSSSKYGATASSTTIKSFTKFLLKEPHPLPPERALSAVASAAAYADNYLGRTLRASGGNGSTTLAGYIRTANPHRIVVFNAGDSRVIQAREGTMIRQTLPQVLPDPEDGCRRKLANSFAGRGRIQPTDLSGTKYEEFAAFVTDQIETWDVQHGDMLISYTDGMAIIRDSKELEVNPQRIAQEASRHATVCEAAGALLLLPQTEAENYITRTQQTAYPKLDDLSVAVGKVVISGAA